MFYRNNLSIEINVSEKSLIVTTYLAEKLILRAVKMERKHQFHITVVKLAIIQHEQILKRIWKSQTLKKNMKSC